MPAPQALQHRIVKALAAQADSVHPGLQVCRQAVLIKAGRIQLQADLGTGSQAETLLQGGQQGPHLGGEQQGWGPTAEIHGG